MKSCWRPVVSEARAMVTSGAPASRNGFQRYTLTELLHMTFPEPCWLVDGLLPAGLTVFAGKSKVGKSFMLLQLARCIGAGEPFLGLATEQRRVLYLTLEDAPVRIHKRLRMQEADDDDKVEFQTQWRVGKDGILDLVTEIESERYGLIIADTLGRVLGASLDPNKSEHMTLALGGLQSAAINHNVVLMDIDHHSSKPSFKMDESDPIADIMGATAKGAVADCIWGLYRKRNDPGATLKALGRDVPETELALQFSGGDTCLWERRGDARNTPKDKAEATILKVLRQMGPADAGEVGEQIKKTRSGVRRILIRMESSGIVGKTKSTTSNGAAKDLYFVL